MRRFVVLDKNIGETPLTAVRKWKKNNPEYADIPASYAGRLDPMASGKLLVLFGEECKRQSAYTDLDKEYEVEVLLDVGSDTGDVLGYLEYSDKETSATGKMISEAINRERGAHMREYPVFSSKTVEGKPLFLYALEGTLKSIEIPKHIELIYRIRHRCSYTISCSDLQSRIYALLSSVILTDEPSKRLGEDFRIDAVRDHWESLFKTSQGRNFTVIRLNVVCASGTYMRSLAGRVGEALGTNALALSIKRTRIGKYISLWNRIGLWIRTY